LNRVVAAERLYLFDGLLVCADGDVAGETLEEPPVIPAASKIVPVSPMRWMRGRARRRTGRAEIGARRDHDRQRHDEGR
jgi:hypothetical protein